MARVELDKVSFVVGSTQILRDVSLTIEEGECLALLGPSGCGKTTTLRSIAGFVTPTSGNVSIGGQSVVNLRPNRRNVGLVFQDYALFPHMTVLQNVSFGLRDKNANLNREIASEMLKTVGMEQYGHRYPHELSGGQQQRVALARALAPHPQAILLDEPFSNLDVEMRKRLSMEVRDILKERGITGIMVTHDQDEAFALGDVVGVMNDGRILQWDTPFNLYHEPANRFVADFIGQGVFIEGTMVTPSQIDTEFGIVNADRAYNICENTSVEILLRPDDVRYDPEGSLKGRITQKAFKGAEIMYSLKLDTGSEVLSLFPSHEDFAIGDEVCIRMDIQHVVAFAKQPQAPHQ